MDKEFREKMYELFNDRLNYLVKECGFSEITPKDFMTSLEEFKNLLRNVEENKDKVIQLAKTLFKRIENGLV